jgi:hypothetical protein
MADYRELAAVAIHSSPEYEQQFVAFRAFIRDEQSKARQEKFEAIGGVR